ncbi:DgyrCDS3445 [Dimorphilus gyrociliatus]|uniref:DgyrCDS3445 n=1 Tax=Dimorphilus gyrociliatus TaxID=2664684 RepID=A0A7I8VD71_9ANNE|nr:DgyrCDS3445 [Dimorphilus gyrociliatus]
MESKYFFISLNANETLVFLQSDTVEAKNIHVRLGDTEMFKDIFEKIKGKLCKIDFLGLCDEDDVEYFIHGQRIKIHEFYNPDKNWENDIALIKLAESVPHLAGDKAPHIQAVKLNDGYIRNFPDENDTCFFQGWGCTKSGGSVNKNALQVQIPIYPNDKCSRTWGIDSSIHLCAGMKSATSTMGICPGDSGGPLVCLRGDTWYQVGVASFTSKYNPGKYPGAFARVSTYYDWIRKQIS